MITIKARKVHGFIEAMRGLMFVSPINPLYFETRFGIHTFFMREAIDVVILDNKNRVCVIKKSLAPWRVFVWNPLYMRVLELPKGSVNAKKITVGEKIRIIEQ